MQDKSNLSRSVGIKWELISKVLKKRSYSKPTFHCSPSKIVRTVKFKLHNLLKVLFNILHFDWLEQQNRRFSRLLPMQVYTLLCSRPVLVLAMQCSSHCTKVSRGAFPLWYCLWDLLHGKTLWRMIHSGFCQYFSAQNFWFYKYTKDNTILWTLDIGHRLGWLGP